MKCLQELYGIPSFRDGFWRFFPISCSTAAACSVALMVECNRFATDLD